EVICRTPDFCATFNSYVTDQAAGRSNSSSSTPTCLKSTAMANPEAMVSTSVSARSKTSVKGLYFGNTYDLLGDSFVTIVTLLSISNDTLLNKDFRPMARKGLPSASAISSCNPFISTTQLP